MTKEQREKRSERGIRREWWYRQSQITEEKRKGKYETQSHRTDKVGNKGTYEDCILSSRRLFFAIARELMMTPTKIVRVRPAKASAC